MSANRVLCPVLVGREREREIIASAIDAARDGRGGLLFLCGEAGLGKSRLVRDAAAAVQRQKITVLTGRAVRRDAPAPFRPLAEAVLPALDPVVRGDLELGPFRRPLLCLAPELTDDEPGEPSPLAVGEGVLRLLRGLAGPRAALLVLEDLHWADPETLTVVEHLADRLEAEPVVCLATVRTGGPSAAADLARTLTERRAAASIQLGGLGSEDVDRMLFACLRSEEVPEELRAFVRAHADGVPFLVEEILAGLVGSGSLARRDEAWRVTGELTAAVPRTFAETVQQRLDVLAPPARRVVSAAAVLGRNFDWTLLCPATGLAEDEVLDGLRQATSVQLLDAEGPGSFAFRHALSAEVVAAQLLPPERARVARRVLDALETSHPAEDLNLALDLAETAGDHARAARYALEAGRRALARGAPATAEVALLRIRRLAPGDHEQLDVEEALAQTWAYQGRVEEASAAGQRVLERLDPTDAERAARLLLVLARAALTAGRFAEAADLVERAHERARGELALRAHALAAQAAIARGDLEAARTLAAELIGDHAPPEVVCEALEVIGRIERNTDAAAAERAFERALHVAERHGLELWRARALHELGTIDLMTRPRYARLLAARQAAEATGAVSALALVDLHLGAVALALWDQSTAVEAFERCVDLSRRMRLSTLGMGLVHLAAAHAMGGDASAMERAVADALRAHPDAIDVRAGVHGRARAFLALRRGDWAGACDAFERAIEILDADPSVAFPFRGLWALLRAALDRDGLAAIAYTKRAAGWGNVLNQATTRQAEAVEAGRHGRGDEAHEYARLAHADLAGRVGEPFRMLPWRIVAEAALRDGWGEPVSWLVECLGVFESAGHTELASSCRSALREAGARVPRRGRGDADVPQDLRKLGVTSREMDVLHLVADGLTNREVAARLHLSPKTVENHVSSLLAKTGAADRAELADRVPSEP